MNRDQLGGQASGSLNRIDCAWVDTLNAHSGQVCLAVVGHLINKLERLKPERFDGSPNHFDEVQK